MQQPWLLEQIKNFPELGGHIGTFASAATLYDVGMNYFWRAKNNKFGGDLIYFQGHSAPGMYEHF